jgi:hypothetical protein
MPVPEEPAYLFFLEHPDLFFEEVSPLGEKHQKVQNSSRMIF